MNATFQWTTAAGETPTEKTGPSYDHSTLTKDGKRRNEMFLLRRKTNNTNQVKTVQLTQYPYLTCFAWRSTPKLV